MLVCNNSTATLCTQACILRSERMEILASLFVQNDVGDGTESKSATLINNKAIPTSNLA